MIAWSELYESATEDADDGSCLHLGIRHSGLLEFDWVCGSSPV